MRLAQRLPLWLICFLVVLAIHVLLALWSLFWHKAPVLAAPPPAPPIMVQLAPPPTPPQEQIEPEPVIEEPEVVEAPEPELVVEKPKPRPKPQPKRDVVKKPQPEKKPEVREELARTDENSTTAQAQDASASTDNTNANAQGAINAQRRAQASWQSRLMGHLGNYKEYPAAAKRLERPGSVKINSIRFTVDGNGRVLNYALVEKSGNNLLDRATLTMIRRAQPLPAPPPEILKNGVIEIVAPINYELKRS